MARVLDHRVALDAATLRATALIRPMRIARWCVDRNRGTCIARYAGALTRPFARYREHPGRMGYSGTEVAR